MVSRACDSTFHCDFSQSSSFDPNSFSFLQFLQLYLSLIMSSSSSNSSDHGESSSRNNNKGYQNDILNPYFMHPNENPSLILVTPLLSNNNYHSWSRSMAMALRSKNKLHFINGVLPRPSDLDPNSIAWDRCNTMIMS